MRRFFWVSDQIKSQENPIIFSKGLSYCTCEDNTGQIIVCMHACDTSTPLITHFWFIVMHARIWSQSCHAPRLSFILNFHGVGEWGSWGAWRRAEVRRKALYYYSADRSCPWKSIISARRHCRNPCLISPISKPWSFTSDIKVLFTLARVT